MAQQSLELLISDNAEKAAQHVARLASELDRLQSAIRPGSIGALANRLKQISGETSAGAMGKVAESISAATTQMERFATSIENAVTTLSGLKGGTGNNALRDVADDARMASSALDGIGQGSLGETVNLGSAVESAQEFTGAIQDANSQMVTLASETQSVGDAAGAAAGGQDEFAGAATGAAGAADEENAALKSLKDALEGVKKNVGGLFSSFARIARFRLFRTIIRAITTAFKEGMENVREYSKAINGLYSKDMDKFDNAVLKMKNSLGASLAVAFQALLPVIHQFINYIIQAANVFNQFIALLNGHTSWTKAVDVVASDFEKAKKSGTGAAKAAKNLLAAWDELNIIQSQTGGGVGGSNQLTSDDYKKMFEESFEFEGWIKDTIEFMESHLPIVHGLLAGIAGYLLGIKNIGVIAVTIGLVTTIENAADIAKNGFTKENLQTAVIGAIEMGLAGGIFGFAAGGAGGAIIGAITGFAVSAMITLVGEFQFLCKKGAIGDAIAAGLGITTAGAIAGMALGTIFGQPILGMIAGAAVGVVVTLIAAFTVDKQSRDGYIDVTEKELQDYVATKMFKSDVRVTLRLINTAVENVEDARTAIADDLGSMSVPLHGLSLGVNKQENYEKIKEEIFGAGGLIEDVQRYANSHQTLIETNMALMPISAEVLSFGQEGWNIILNDFNDLGGQLSAELSKGFVDGVAQFNEEAVEAMTVEMAELSAALAQQTAISTAQNNLQMNLMSGTMTAEEALAQYAKELESGMINSEFQMAAGFEAQAAYYTKKAEFHPEEAEYWLDMAAKASALAKQIRDEAPSKAMAGVAEQMEPGYELYRSQAASITPEAMLEAISYVERTNPLGSYEDLADRVFERLFGEESYKWIKAGHLNPYSMFSPETLEALQGTDLGKMLFPSMSKTNQAVIQSDQPPIIQAPGGQYSTPEEESPDPQMSEANATLGRMLTQLTALVDKNWTVNVTPSVGLGRVVGQSVNMMNRATGGKPDITTSFV